MCVKVVRWQRQVIQWTFIVLDTGDTTDTGDLVNIQCVCETGDWKFLLGTVPADIHCGHKTGNACQDCDI